MDIENGLGFSIETLAEAFGRCFEGYVIPIQLPGVVLGELAMRDTLDLASSQIAVENSEIVGMLLVNRRGRECRVAAMAVAPSHRATGVGSELMTRMLQTSAERGDDSIVLEAIESNTGAIRFYERFGFTVQCRLIGASRSLAAGDAGRFREVRFEEMARAALGRDESGTPWEMRGATVAQMATPTRAFAVDGLYSAVFPTENGELVTRSMLLSGEDDETKLRQLLRGLEPIFPGRKFRVPVYFPEPVFGSLLEADGFEFASLAQVLMTRLASSDCI